MVNYDQNKLNNLLVVEKEEIVSFVPNFFHKTHATNQINFFQKIDEKFSGFCNFIRLIEAEATLVLSVQGLRSLSLFLICVLFKPHFNRKTVAFNGIPTRIVGVGGKHADH